jgi:hypothetical protein
MIHDIHSRKRHKFCHTIAIVGDVDMMRAGDGGLVCVVALKRDFLLLKKRKKKKKKDFLSIVVFNPLKRQEKRLPNLPDAMGLVLLVMVQLVMDKVSRCYKIIVVDQKQGKKKDAVARIYSSETQQWTSPRASIDLIFRYKHSWSKDYPVLLLDY